jgi:hypothetical protein
MHPDDLASRFFQNRHALILFAYPKQLDLISDVCSTFVLDNGAFTHWSKGGEVDVHAYADWVEEWRRHPAFDWCLIPDKIDGDMDENDGMIEEWGLPKEVSVPVWHYHEDLRRLDDLSMEFPRIALGSSGIYKPGQGDWWGRTLDAFEHIQDGTKVHGLRMLNPNIFTQVPLSSADSSNIARNIGEGRWSDTGYTPVTKLARAQVLADRIEAYQSPRSFTYQDERPMDLFNIL